MQNEYKVLIFKGINVYGISHSTYLSFISLSYICTSQNYLFVRMYMKQ